MTLQANELRLGNYVNCPRQDQNPFRIDGIEFLNKNNCKVEMEWMPNFHPLTWELKDLQPMPLTEEIVKKTGFVQQLEPSIWFKKPFHLNLDSTWWWCIDGCFEGEEGSKWREVKHLHQLQNLYFNLTGEELDVKL